MSFKSGGHLLVRTANGATCTRCGSETKRGVRLPPKCMGELGGISSGLRYANQKMGAVGRKLRGEKAAETRWGKR